jgi:hypothetical protein
MIHMMGPDTKSILRTAVLAWRHRSCLELLSCDQALSRLLLDVENRSLNINSGVIKELDDRRLSVCWQDDLTLGWVYQFWVSLDKEILDQRISNNRNAHISSDEIATKTQLFSERYMVEWAVQNSLGAKWLAICEKNKWTPLVVSQKIFSQLTLKRKVWKSKSGDLPLSGLERFWCYFVEPTTCSLKNENTPDSIRQIKILDPACGTGHFLLIIMEYLIALYQEEALHRNECWALQDILQQIITTNLYGIDIDSKVIEVAKRALRLKLQRLCPNRIFAIETVISSNVEGFLGPKQWGTLWRDNEPNNQIEHPFFEINREDYYDIVIGNPPYLGRRRLKNVSYITEEFPLGAFDLSACFLLRGLQLCKTGGISSLLVQRNWLFMHSAVGLRNELIGKHHLALVADLENNAFSESNIASVIVQFHKNQLLSEGVVVLSKELFSRPGPKGCSESQKGLLCQSRKYIYSWDKMKNIPGSPFVYWWPKNWFSSYQESMVLQDKYAIKQGMATSDNFRFLRKHWEVTEDCYLPYIKGQGSDRWFDKTPNCINWQDDGLAVKLYAEMLYKNSSRTIKNEQHYGKVGITFQYIGTKFGGRLILYPGVFDVSGSLVITNEPNSLLCWLNSAMACEIMKSLNPSLNFQVGDVSRLLLVQINKSDAIITKLKEAFVENEQQREPSRVFVGPGQTCWNYAQDWGQRSVDRSFGSNLPKYLPLYIKSTLQQRLSFAFGQVMGRYSEAEGNFLMVAGKSNKNPILDSFQREVLQEWNVDVYDYLQRSFFREIHFKLYEKRPVYWPLSSNKRNFVLWVNVHKFDDISIEDILLKQLQPLLSAENSVSVQEELMTWINDIQRCFSIGPSIQTQEVSAAFKFEERDGVLLAASPLWPLLLPFWKEPKKCWEMLHGIGKKRCDWSSVAKRYWPSRVENQCKKDPSIAYEQGCLKRLHPKIAQKWGFQKNKS